MKLSTNFTLFGLNVKAIQAYLKEQAKDRRGVRITCRGDLVYIITAYTAFKLPSVLYHPFFLPFFFLCCCVCRDFRRSLHGRQYSVVSVSNRRYAPPSFLFLLLFMFLPLPVPLDQIIQLFPGLLLFQQFV